MVHTIKEIKPGVKFKYVGDLHVTGKIGNAANVNVKGSLIVDGDIEEGGIVHLELGDVGGSPMSHRKLTVKGRVHDNVSITSDGAYYHIHGSVGNNCNVETANWAIHVEGGVGESSNLSTTNSGIRAGTMAANSSAINKGGTHATVRVAGADDSVTLESDGGCVYVNDKLISGTEPDSDSDSKPGPSMGSSR